MIGNNGNDLLKRITQKLIDCYCRHFTVNKNSSIKAEKLEQIPDAINQIEKEFENRAKTALEYFNPILNQDFHFGIKVTELIAPHSIKEIINNNSRFDWIRHVILSAYPQPLYRDRYNLILKKGVEMYIENKLELA